MVQNAARGLLPFNLEDRALFAQLERGPELQRILASMLDPGYRFGILVAPSGAGKTSFLRAGLLAQLRMQKDKIPAFYVEISNEDPLESIKREVKKQGLNEPIGVLLLDQFEQFFLHQRMPAQRRPLIDALTRWSQPHSGVQVLVSIRAENLWQMFEIQQQVNYQFSNQSYFNLTKFSPNQAVTALKVLCGTAGIGFDWDFAQKVIDRDLCDREDGMVSPVNLGIVVLVLSTGRRALNASDFKAYNGIEGLLEDWLNSQLEAAKVQGLDKTAILVLTVFCDFDNNRRAGILTVADIAAHLSGDVTPGQIERAVEWLTSRDVRLIAPAGEGEIAGYQLSHERLIPAVRKLANKVLDAAAHANALLNRRVNEWINNDRSSRFLLPAFEYWQINRQRPYLIWGEARHFKEALLEKTQRNLHSRAILSGVLLLLLLGGYTGYRSYISRDEYQIDRMVQQIKSVALTEQTSRMLPIWCGLLVVAGRSPDALDAAAKMLDIDYYRAENYAYIARAMAKTNQNPKKAFDMAMKAAEKLSGTLDRAKAYSFIAQIMAEVKQDPTQALDMAMKATEELSDYDSQAHVYVSIAQVMRQVGQDFDQVINKATQATEKLQNSNPSKSNAYSDIAQTMAKAGRYTEAMRAAEKIASNGNPNFTYAAVAEELAQAGKYTEAMRAAEKIRDDVTNNKSNAYSDIAQTMAKAGKYTEAMRAAEKIPNDFNKTRIYAIAQAMTLAGRFSAAIHAAEKIPNDSDYKIRAYVEIAQAMAEVKQDPTQVLDMAMKAAEKIPYDNNSYKPRAYVEIAQAMAKVGKYSQSLIAASMMPDDNYYKREAYTKIAQAMVDASQDPAQALHMAMQAAEKLPDDTHYDLRGSAYAEIAQLMGQANKYVDARSSANHLLRESTQPQNSTTEIAGAALFLAVASDFKQAIDITTDSDWRGRPNALNEADRFTVYLFILREYLRKTRPDALKVWEKEGAFIRILI